MRTLLITGGSGYLGRHLVRRAMAGWQVVATYFFHPNLPGGCRAVPLDIRNRPAVDRLLAELRPTSVIHTAYDMSSPEALQSVIVEGTRHIAAAAAAVRARLLTMSTDVVFEGERGPYREADPPSPVTPYGRAKAEAERIVAGLCPQAAIVRTSLIYGFSPADPRTRWVVDSLRYGRPITLFTDELRCPVWVEQLAEALLELAGEEGEGWSGVWHLAGPQALSRYEFGVRLARSYGFDPAAITPGQSRKGGVVRPRDCRLEIGRAQARLRSPLWGVDKVLDTQPL